MPTTPSTRAPRLSNGNSSTVTVSKASGTTTGDLMLVFIDVNPATNVATVPTGWAPIGTVSALDGNGGSYFCYWKVAVASDSISGSYGWSMNSAGAYSGIMVTVVAGAIDSTPAESQYDSGTITNAPTVPSVYAGVSGAIEFSVLLNRGLTATQPTGWSMVQSDAIYGQYVAVQTQTNMGPTPATSWALTGSGNAFQQNFTVRSAIDQPETLNMMLG